MKKGYSTLAMILVLLCAFSASSIAEGGTPDANRYRLYEEIALLYDSYDVDTSASDTSVTDAFDYWPKEAYENAISLFKASGVLPADALSDTSAYTREALRDALWDQFPGVVSGFIGRVLENQWGNSNYWSLADKAWYTQLLKEHQLLTPYDRLYMQPTESQSTVEEIRKAASTYISDKHNLSPDQVAGFDTYYSFFAKQNDAGNPIWRVFFCESDTHIELFMVELSDKGAVLSETSGGVGGVPGVGAIASTPAGGRLYELSLEDQAEYAKRQSIPLFGMPGTDDLTQAQALQYTLCT